MDQIAAADYRTIAVGGSAGFIAAGIDHGVQISGKVI